MVWVNILWLISLVLSLTCALIATLLQQWARRYIETPKSSGVMRYRARVRTLLLAGVKLYQIPLIAEMLPTLLHLSVFLFFGGLMIAFHTIHKRVAIAVDVAVGLLGLAYIVMSILPCLDVSCPYRTPISQMLWYPCHAFLSFATLCLHICVRGLQGLLTTRSQVLSRGQRWLASRGSAAHWQYITYGLEKSIAQRAIEMLKDGDSRRVTLLFTQLALGDRSRFLNFAASIPRHRIPDLILPTELNSLPLVPLLVLLRSCLAGTYSQANEDIHSRALLVCLHAICHIAKGPTLPDLDFMRAHLANTEHMVPLWWNSDIFICTTSRSICALIARKLVRKRRLGEADLRWLQEVIGESPNAILEASVTVRDQMNFKAFVIGVLPQPPSNLPTEDATLFNETIAILLSEGTDDQDYSTTSDWQNQLSKEIERIHLYDHEDRHEVLDRLHVMFPSLVAPFLPSAEARYSSFSPVDPSSSPPSPPPSPSFVPSVPQFHSLPLPLYYPHFPFPPPAPPPVTAVAPSWVSRTPSSRSRFHSPASRSRSSSPPSPSLAPRTARSSSLPSPSRAPRTARSSSPPSPSLAPRTGYHSM